MKIAFIGLGAMGLPMALKLVQAGHEVTGFDVRAGAATPLEAAGGHSAASAAAAAQGAELLWLMVVSGEQAAQVLFDHGAAAALPAGAIVVAGCTQAPAAAQRLGERLAEMGLAMLDAPVSGGVAGATSATLTVMASGDAHALERAQPALAATARRIFDVGREAGMGSTAKMINQLLCGVHIAAAAEAMHVAERAGVPLATVHEIVSVSAGNSWMWGDRGPRMMQRRPAGDERGRHLRQGSRHRARSGPAGSRRPAAHGGCDADVPRRVRRGPRRGRRQPGDPRLSRAERQGQDMSDQGLRPTIGFIGVGLMGHGMAKNILAKGYPLVVLGHRNRAPVEHLVSLGAREAASPRELAESCDIVHLCVTGSPQVEALVRGPDGIAAAKRRGLIVIDCSTSNPVSTLALAAELAATRHDARRCPARSHAEGGRGRHARRPWSAPIPTPSRGSSRCCAAGPTTSCTSARSGSATR